LSVSDATVYRMLERGDLPRICIGNSLRVVPTDLAQFVASQRTGGR
jgi:excisionase family DNA binding protein